MLISFQNRFRFPWCDALKKISLDMVIPLFTVPLLLGLASINLYVTIIMVLAGCMLLSYIHYLLKGARQRSRFFFVWIFWSVIFMTILFESTVPLYELLPEENLILVALGFASLCCFFKVKQRAALNQMQLHGSNIKQELPKIVEEEGEQQLQLKEEQQTLLIGEMEVTDMLDDYAEEPANICKICRKHVPAHTVHCALCQTCVKRHEHHSLWLDCCIGADNYRYYIWGLVFAELALLFGSNLTLTAICHPFMFVRILNVAILLPDDCSDVYGLYELAIGFVSSIYAVIIAIYIAYNLGRFAYYRCRGSTISAYRHGVFNKRKRTASSWEAFFC